MLRLPAIALAGLTALASLAVPAHSQESIKIGVMFPLTGPLSSQGRPERDAIKMAFDEINNTIAGRKVELLFEDSAGRPDTGLTKFKALVERDNVHLLLSELTSSIGAAVAIGAAAATGANAIGALATGAWRATRTRAP